MGKSGHIARKIASTLASTGTPAYFVHPAEASHGDLGMVEARRRVHRHLLFRRERRAAADRAAGQAPRRQADRDHRQARLGAGARGRRAPRRRRSRRKPARTTSRRPRAPPPRSRSATRSRSRCSTRAASPPTTSRARHPRGRLPAPGAGSPGAAARGDVMRTRRRGAEGCRAARRCRQAVVEMTRGRIGMTAVRRRRRPGARHLHRRRPAPHAREGRRRSTPARVDDVMTAGPAHHPRPRRSPPRRCS